MLNRLEQFANLAVMFFQFIIQILIESVLYARHVQGTDDLVANKSDYLPSRSSSLRGGARKITRPVQCGDVSALIEAGTSGYGSILKSSGLGRSQSI